MAIFGKFSNIENHFLSRSIKNIVIINKNFKDLNKSLKNILVSDKHLILWEAYK